LLDVEDEETILWNCLFDLFQPLVVKLNRFFKTLFNRSINTLINKIRNKSTLIFKYHLRSSKILQIVKMYKPCFQPGGGCLPTNSAVSVPRLIPNSRWRTEVEN
jgi:hypothetical protein